MSLDLQRVGLGNHLELKFPGMAGHRADRDYGPVGFRWDLDGSWSSVARGITVAQVRFRGADIRGGLVFVRRNGSLSYLHTLDSVGACDFNP